MNGVQEDTCVQSYQPGVVGYSQGQQVHVRYLAVAQHPPGAHPGIVQQADVIKDEPVMW